MAMILLVVVADHAAAHAPASAPTAPWPAGMLCARPPACCCSAARRRHAVLVHPRAASSRSRRHGAGHVADDGVDHVGGAGPPGRHGLGDERRHPRARRRARRRRARQHRRVALRAADRARRCSGLGPADQTAADELDRRRPRRRRRPRHGRPATRSTDAAQHAFLSGLHLAVLTAAGLALRQRRASCAATCRTRSAARGRAARRRSSRIEDAAELGLGGTIPVFADDGSPAAAAGRRAGRTRVACGAMPIHLRAEPGDYAPSVLCPGDPRRAAYIAETFFDPGARLVNEERGHARVHRHVRGPADQRAVDRAWGARRRGSCSRSWCMLGATRLIRVGTCGGFAGSARAWPTRSSRCRPRARTTRRCGTPTWPGRRRAATFDLVATAVRWAARPAPPCTSARSSRAASSTTPTSTNVAALGAARPPRHRDGGGDALHDRRRAPGRGAGDDDRERPPRRHEDDASGSATPSSARASTT